MPLIDKLAGDYVYQGPKSKGIYDEPLNKKAYEDFCFLVNKSGLSYYVRLNHVVISGESSKPLADCIVLGVDSKSKMLKIPKSEFSAPESGMVAVVRYNDENVSGVYLFSYEEIQKGGAFSRFKNLKKHDAYGIKIAGIDKKCAKNKFGVIFGSQIRTRR